LLKTSALASVVSRYLSLKRLPFGIHLLALVIHHNSTIH
jgi:primosomal replication protein N